MAAPLDYAPTHLSRRSKPIAALAWLGVVLPLLIAGALYGEWLLAWWALGHPPQPSVDDPAGIPFSKWLHPVVFFALLSVLPGVLVALTANVLHFLFNRPSRVRAAVQWVVLISLWAGLMYALSIDPGGVLYWWWD